MVHEQFWHRAIWQRAYPVESKGTNFSDTVPQRTSKRRACSCSVTAEALSCYSTDSDGAVSTEDSPKKRTKPFTATFAQSKYFNSIVHVKSVEHRWTIIRPLHQFTATTVIIHHAPKCLHRRTVDCVSSVTNELYYGLYMRYFQY